MRHLGWLLVGLAACDVEPVELSEAPASVPPEPEQTSSCPKQVFPENEAHSGTLVWNGQAFVLGWAASAERGGGLEAWSPAGTLQWSTVLPFVQDVWRDGAQVFAVTMDAEQKTLAWRVELDGAVAPVPWPRLELPLFLRVLADEAGAWALSELGIHRIVDGEVVEAYPAEGVEGSIPDEVFLGAAVLPGGRLRAASVMQRFRTLPEYRLTTFEAGGEPVREPVAPEFEPRAVALVPPDRVVVAGVRLGAQQNDDGDLSWEHTGGRLVGLTAEPLDYEPPACPPGEPNRAGLDHLLTLRDGGWLAVGHLCTRYEADLWLLRLDATGDVRWQSRLALGPLTEFRGMAEADDGTLALSVRSGTMFIGSTSWLMFVDPDGRCLDTVR